MQTDLKSVYEIFMSFVNDLLGVLPSFLIALAVLVGFVMAGRLSRSAVRKVTSKFWDDKSLQSLATTITSSLFIVVGLFVSAAILFPGLEAGDLVSVLGLSSVALGFAFKDIAQNFLAGVLILSGRPFTIGDQIQTNDFEGTVKEITFRSTEVETYDNEKVIIPNSLIFTNPMTVLTANPARRRSFSTGIGYNEDIEEAREVIYEALTECDLVDSERGSVVRVEEHGGSSINFKIKFWAESDRSSGQGATDQVATRVKYALDEAGIEIPFPQRTLHVAPGTLGEGGQLELQQAS